MSKITTTKPIPLEVIQKVRELLQESPRELAWLELSLNTGLRGGDVLKLRLSHLKEVENHLEITYREAKTGRIRNIVTNQETTRIVRNWLSVHPRKTDYLFEGKRGKMNTSYWSQLLKGWCQAVGYDEPRTATHSVRKTFVREHYNRGTRLAVLMHLLNHSSERNTLIYCGLMEEDERKVYEVRL